MTKKRPDPRLDELARVMRQVLEISGLSRREIARRLGGDYAIRRILDGSTELRVRQLLGFADALEMKAVEILRIALADDGRLSPMAERIQQRTRELAGLTARLLPAAALDPPGAAAEGPPAAGPVEPMKLAEGIAPAAPPTVRPRKGGAKRGRPRRARGPGAAVLN